MPTRHVFLHFRLRLNNLFMMCGQVLTMVQAGSRSLSVSRVATAPIIRLPSVIRSASTWPASTKRRMTPPHPTPSKIAKYIKTYLGGWGSGKYAERSYESIVPSFKLFGHGKRPETHQHKFSCFCTSSSSPICFVYPPKAWITLFEKP